MINFSSIEAVRSKKLDQKFFLPDHAGYCFSGIPGTIFSAFGLSHQFGSALPDSVLPESAQCYDHVILMFIDAFGWRFFERYKDSIPVLGRFQESGICSCITSQFPSTTAAHVPTIHTGLPVGGTGLYEWFYYEPKVGAVIVPFLFSLAGTTSRDELITLGHDPKDIFPKQTIYDLLARQGISSYVLQSDAYSGSSFSKVVTRGSTMIPFKNLNDGLNKLADSVARASGPSYHFIYLDSIDSVGHHSGPTSAAFDREVKKVFSAIESVLLT